MSHTKSPEQTKSSEQENSPFKDSLNLPRTEFSLRANSATQDPKTLARWASENVYAQVTAAHQGALKYIVHDGPPYANGNIHLGHAYNKILKDIIAKAHRMMGFHVPVVPGWDCHGLPIEQKVSQENPGLTGAPLKKACREYALRWVNVQREEFKALGVMMDWDNPYITMDPAYEADTVRAFGQLVEQGCVERKNKTIPWCPTCQTALASAEIEYQERKDPSIYVTFELDHATSKKLFSDVTVPINFLIWTTTPWTLPLNRAVVLKTDAEYQLVNMGGQYLIMGALLAPKIAALAQVEYEVVTTFNASKLKGAQAHHPFAEGLMVPIIFDQSVGLDEGTACVHCAPGCGPIDYEMGVKNGLEIYSPVTADGRYSDAIKPAELTGMPVADGQIWVIKTLVAANKMFYKSSLRHSYPHCWRCRNGLIFRATPQWFCNLEHESIKQRALKAIDTITFSPEQGKNFLSATVGSRWEWCLSRQRAWGVPIPALISLDGKDVFTSGTFITKVAEGIAREGIEYWSRVTLQELRDAGLLAQDFPIDNYRKETDILDVWFDSGVSHYAVLQANPLLQFPADVYIEGIDQHRGWFQSSLLTSVVMNGQAPMRTIMTHGYTVDEQGRKMSKSLGNGVAPQEIIAKLGTDGLRLWVSTIGREGDIIVSETLLNNVGQVLRKIRNSCRFLLQNLYDYDHDKDAVEFEHLHALDRYALLQLNLLQKSIIASYKQGDLTAIFHALSDYCTVELSAFYGDIVKDRLYCEQAKGVKRRSTQTVFWHILDALTRLIAPIMSFTAEEVSDFYQKEKAATIHVQKFADLTWVDDLFTQSEFERYEKQWALLKELRSAVLKMIEVQREQGLIKHPLEGAITLCWPRLQELTVINGDMTEFLKEFFILSQVTIVEVSDNLEQSPLRDLFVQVAHAQGSKCPRCWQWSTQVDARGLDSRCAQIV